MIQRSMLVSMETFMQDTHVNGCQACGQTVGQISLLAPPHALLPSICCPLTLKVLDHTFI
jgi:hypothetical protein